MAYKALYRTYRPQRFDEVVGQEVIVKTLQNALANGKITHAYLFSGPRGTGKTTIARLLAKAINCNQPIDGEPCNECESCREIMEGNNPDVIEIDAASNNGVEEIREIREKVKFLPGESKYKIYIIDEVHMLTANAFNALLKTLEEPPKHVIFILATTEPQKVLATILSRCQRYDFKGLSVDEISGHIKNIALKENVQITDEAVIGLAESAEGGMRDALSFLDQAISLSDDVVTIDEVNSVTGNLGHDKLIELAECFEEKNISKAVKIVNELLNFGKEVSKIVSGLLQFYRDALLYKNVDTTEYKKYIFEKENFRQLVSKIDEKKIFYYVDVLSDTQSKLKTSSTPQIFLDVSMIKMVNVSQDDLYLISRVKEIEEKLNNMSSVSYEGLEPNYTPIDTEALAKLEDKINHVISELGNYNFPSFVQRISALEIKGSENISLDQIKEINKEIDKIKEELYLVKANYSSLANYQDNQSDDVKTIIDPEINEKILKIEEKLSSVPQESLNYDQINDMIDDRLKNARREVSMDYDKINAMLDEKVRNIELNGGNVEMASQFNDDISLRLEKIEEKLYRIMSGALAKETAPTPKAKRRSPNENQMVLFGNDMVALDNIEKRSVKERVDFDAFTKSEKKKDEPRKIDIFSVMSEQEREKAPSEPSIVFEKTVMPQVQEVKKEEPKEVNVFGSSKYNVDSVAEKSLNRSGELLERGEEKSESKVDLFGSVKYDVNTAAEQNLNKSVAKLSEVEVVRDIKKEPIIAKEAPVISDNAELDEYERYDISVIERILTDSRTAEAKEDKNRVVSLWSRLVEMTSPERRSVAEVLKDGVVSAVGNREIIIVYESPSVCKQVMKRSFRKDALKVLFDLFGSTYKYMALPNSVWQAKRTEYINKYRMGNNNIKLNPINDVVLKVLTSSDDQTPEEKMLSNARSLFGDSIEIKG